MRISSDPTDCGYTPRAHEYRVWLAGSERNNIVTADDSARFATTFRRNEFGEPVKDKNGAQVVERFWGDVRIERQACDEQEDEMGALGAAIYGLIVSQP
jgi:hypothetical protein